MADQNQSPPPRRRCRGLAVVVVVVVVDDGGRTVQQNAVRHADDVAFDAQAVLRPDAQVHHVSGAQLLHHLQRYSGLGRHHHHRGGSVAAAVVVVVSVVVVVVVVVVVKNPDHPAGQVVPVIHPPRRDVVSDEARLLVGEGPPGRVQDEARASAAASPSASTTGRAPGERGQEGAGRGRGGVDQQGGGGARAAATRGVAGGDGRPVGITVQQQRLLGQGQGQLTEKECILN